MWLNKIYKPEVFQGNQKKVDYFEGWYFKCIDQKEQEMIVVIPGISYEKKNPHCFIQVFLPKIKKTYYFKYPIHSFSYDLNKFYIAIENNIFTEQYMYLDLSQENLRIKGLIWFSLFTKIPLKRLSPGIMGPFSFIPFLECYHGIVSMNHWLKGSLVINNSCVRFDNGKGYIEKDWGISFPKAYLWMQSNHFKNKNLAFTFSVADIPLKQLRFTGFLCAIAIKDQVRLWTTYTGAKIERFINSGGKIEIDIIQGQEKIEVILQIATGYLLKAPVKGAMNRVIYETLHGEMELKIYYKNKLKVHEKSKTVGYEQSGNIDLLKV